MLLELAQDSASETEAARGYDHPHALQLEWRIVMELQRSAPDGHALASGHQQQAGWGPQALLVGRDAALPIEARLRSGVEVLEVLVKAIASVRVSRIDGVISKIAEVWAFIHSARA